MPYRTEFPRRTVRGFLAWLVLAGCWCAALRAADPATSEPSVCEAWAAEIHGASFEQLSPAVVEKLKLTVADCVGVLAHTRQLDEVQRYAGAILAGGRAEATELVGGTRVPTGQAAAINAFAIHGHEIDDSNLRSSLRASCIAVPGALAAAERAQTTGRELFTALAISFGVSDRLGFVLNHQPEGELHAKGWMPSSVCGGVGAAAAVARLEGQSTAQIASALGLAASGANGTFQYYRDGSDEKRIHVARSQWLAVESAALARAGFQGAHHALEGEAGLLAVLGFTDRADELRAPLMAWEGVLHVKPKFFACSQGVIPWLEILQTLQRATPFGAEQVRTITIHTTQPASSLYIKKINAYRAPASTVEAQLNVNLGVALFLVRGDAYLDDYHPEHWNADAVQQLARLVRATTDPQHNGLLEVELRDGRTLAGRYDPAILLAPYAPDAGAYRRKFDRLTSGYSAAAREALWQHALALVDAPRVEPWVARLIELLDVRQ
ncbi:MAG: MmgE/PrpD family protein [Pirellulales bacterium]|nr:MmgE/PrpD family protein [Pirellulales bacterium]